MRKDILVVIEKGGVVEVKEIFLLIVQSEVFVVVVVLKMQQFVLVVFVVGD